MTLREEVARAIASHVESDEEEWQPHVEEADVIISRCGPRLATPEDEAWKVAQLAATLHAGKSEWYFQDAVGMARDLLAEARRQTTPEPDRDAR